MLTFSLLLLGFYVVGLVHALIRLSRRNSAVVVNLRQIRTSIVMRPINYWVSFVFPCFMHYGIGDRDGTIRHYGQGRIGTVTSGNFSEFPGLTRFIDLDLNDSNCADEFDYSDAINGVQQQYNNRQYSIFYSNCVDFVVEVLNEIEYNGGGWGRISVLYVMLSGSQPASFESLGDCAFETIRLLPFMALWSVGICWFVGF